MGEELGGIRLQKYLSICGVSSRRKCEELIAAGRVGVNGAVVTEMGVRVREHDAVSVDGNPVSPVSQKVYIAFYKPSLVVTTAMDPEGRKTVLDFFTGLEARIYPVGRLDYETEGLLLMTNDGDWANRITHPSYNLEKEYLVKVTGPVTDGQVGLLESGVMLEGKRTWPAKVTHVRRIGPDTFMNVTIHEGRNRQVRRMIEAIGHKAVYLKRVRIGSVLLGDMKAGQWRYLDEVEARQLAAMEP